MPTEPIILDFQVDLEDSIESIESLTKANKALREERKNLNLTTDEGKKRVNEINATLDKNTNKIKDNVSALEKQKLNVGNYKSALDGVIPGLSGFIDKTVSGTKAVYAMSLAQKLLLGPIGLIILALTAIIKYLTGSEEGMDKLAIIMAKVGAVVSVITDRLIQLGGALVKILTGDFAGGIDGLKKSFEGVGDEIQREVDLAVDLAERLDILDDLNLALTIRLSEQENVIKNLIIQSRNRFLSEEERMKKLVEAADLEKRLTGERIALRLAELNIIASEIQLRNNEKEAAQQAGETTIEFAKRLASNNNVLLADRKKIAEQLGQYNDLLDNQANIQEKIQIQQDAISAKIAENLRAAKALEDANRRAANQPNIVTKDPLKGAFSTELKEFDEFGRAKIRIDKRINDALLKSRGKLAQESEDFAKGQAKLEEKLGFARLDAAAQIAGAASTLFDQQSAEYKAFATFQTIISTFSTAQKAYEAAFTPPTVVSPGLAAAYVAAAIAQGLAQVAAINGVQFDQGGVVLKGRSHAHGGIPIEAEGDEIILTKGVYRNPQLRQMASNLNVAGGGIKFADGGLVSRSISNPINQSFEISNLIKNMPAPIVSVKEINRGQKAVKVKQNISQR